MTARDVFRIVHLSDLHLTERDDAPRSEPRILGPLSGMNESFRRLIASDVVKQADLILVTGDVTDRGSLREWRLFWSILSAAGLRDRTLAIPGNHDTCNLGLWPLVGKPIVVGGLARASQGLELGCQETRFPWTRLVGDSRVLIVGLDSCNHGNWSVLTNAVGRLGEHQLERLARLLRRYANVPVKILTLHHSPNIPRADAERKRGVKATGILSRWGHEMPHEDRFALRLLALTHGVRLVVHGHLHRAEERRVNGVRIIGAPASTEPDRSGKVSVWRYAVHAGSGRVIAELDGVAVR